MALDLKHGARRDGLPTFAAWLDLAAPFVRDADPLISIPLHGMRLIRRGYNQSAWLAQALFQRTNKAWSPQALIRRRSIPQSTRPHCCWALAECTLRVSRQSSPENPNSLKTQHFDRRHLYDWGDRGEPVLASYGWRAPHRSMWFVLCALCGRNGSPY